MKPHDRRTFIAGSSALFAATLASPFQSFAAQKKAAGTQGKKEEKEENVSTNEDLMREHGVLNRLLLIYDEGIRRMEANQKFDPAIIGKSAALIQKFIQDYHEKLEEDHLFPRFQRAGKLVDLVKTLRTQHAAGRAITNRIIEAAKNNSLQSSDLAAFNRMYRPHEAREDTVLFPALHGLVSEHEYDALGEEFERIERATFGGDGFDMAVEQVTELEKQMGIYDLSQFTPK